MAAMAQEAALNGGIYPKNGGDASMAEVARRAGVHVTSFYTKALRDLGREVKAWADKVGTGAAIAVAEKKSVSKRLDDWRALYARLLQSHRDTELELQQVEHELRQEKESVVQLSSENEQLKKQLRTQGGKVVQLHKKPR